MEGACVLCGQEVNGNIDFSVPVTCWRCVNFLVDAPPERVKKLYDTLVAKDSPKAVYVLKWVKEVDNGEPAGSHLDRAGADKKVQPSRKGRSKQSCSKVGVKRSEVRRVGGKKVLPRS